MKTLLTLCISLLILSAYSQENRPVTTFADLKLNGMVNLNKDGVVFLSQASKKSKALLTLIDTSGRFAWSSEIDLKKTRGKTPSKIWIQSDGVVLYIFHLNKGMLYATMLNTYDGSLLQPETELIAWKGELNDPMPAVINRRVCLLKPSFDGIELIKINPLHPDSTETILLTAEPIEGGKTILQPAGIVNNRIIAYSYLVNSNHSELNLRLFAFDNKGEMVNEKLHTFKSNKNAFAPMGVNDPHLFYFTRGRNAWYLIGKLDMATYTAYAPNSAIEGCFGLWMAKIDDYLTLDYFSEQPFEVCAGVISHGVIRKAVFFDIKEDENLNLFVQLAEIPNAIAYSSYLFEFNENGGFEFLITGLSEFNFFDYNKRGVRHVSRKMKKRLMNDDWRYYATNFLDDIKLKPRHGNILKFIWQTGSANQTSKEAEAYNFVMLPGKKALIFEYLDTKHKQLHIYKIAL